MTVFQDGKLIGSLNSCPGMFMEDSTEDDFKPLVEGREALTALLGLEEAETARLFLSDESSVDPLDLHQNWISTLALPEYSLGMGYRYVERGESAAFWTKV